MRQTSQLAAFFLTVALSLFAEPAVSSAQQINVGVSAPLSGPLSEYGAAVRNGFMLAKEQKPELSRFELIFDDNEYEAARSLSSYRKLKSQDHVQILYLWGEPGFGSVAPVAENDKFPLFGMSTDRDPGVGKHYVVRVSSDTHSLAGKLVEFLRTKQIEKVDMLMAEDPFFEAYRKSLNEELGSDSAVTTVATVAPDSQDFRSIILKLKQRKPAVTAVFLQAGQARSFFKQAEVLQFKSIFLGTDVFESREEVRESGPWIDGALFPNFMVPADFHRQYLAKFGNDAQVSYAYIAYAFATNLPQLAGGALDAESVLKRTSELTLQNTSGMFEYRNTAKEGAHFEFPVVLRTVKVSAATNQD